MESAQWAVGKQSGAFASSSKTFSLKWGYSTTVCQSTSSSAQRQCE